MAKEGFWRGTRGISKESRIAGYFFVMAGMLEGDPPLRFRDGGDGFDPRDRYPRMLLNLRRLLKQRPRLRVRLVCAAVRAFLDSMPEREAAERTLPALCIAVWTDPGVECDDTLAEFAMHLAVALHSSTLFVRNGLGGQSFGSLFVH